MFVKSYIAKDLPEAMDRIRRELGPDAMILSNRQIREKGLKGLWGKKLVEVTVAFEPVASKPVQPERRPPERAPVSAAPAAAPARRPAQEFSRQLAQKKQELGGKTPPKPDASTPETKAAHDRRSAAKLSAEAEAVGNLLMEREVFVSVAQKIAQKTEEIISKFDDDAGQVACSLIADMLGEPAVIKLKKYRMNIIMLLGPTGVGKTTTIVKLAGLYTINQGLKVGFINTDTYRVAAQEQLKAYAEIMELPCYTVYSPEDMEAALVAMQDRDVVLIDTAGKSPADKKYKKDVEAYIHQSAADEILLCVSASMGYGASRELIEHYSFLQDYKLVITKLDEVSAWGSVLNISSLAKKPIAYLTAGQNVPFDISVPDSNLVAKNLLEGQ